MALAQLSCPDPAEELAGWIRLERTPGVGPETARRLLGTFGLPSAVLAAGRAQLKSVVSERIAAELSSTPSPELLSLIDKSLDWARQPGNCILTLADPAYPRSLLDISDPPLLLYVKGRVDLLNAPAIAVVGSRNATAQGVSNAGKFSEALSNAGLTVVSGMALGIDTAAHQGGLRGIGSSIAVIGTGADIVYPARNHGLAHTLAAHGCIVSEYPLGMQALPPNFPRRNRIISGLSRGVLVIEAAAQSGSLITARMAGDQGGDVFAIPGSIHSPLSKGCHLLIKQGAKLVESAQDILDELNAFSPPASFAPASAANETADPLLTAIGYDPVDFDTLVERSNLDSAALTARLLTLEMDGKIEMLPGGMYRRLD